MIARERDASRVESLLTSLETIAGGALDHRAPVGAQHDELDAIAFAVNVIVGELAFTTRGLERAKAEAEAANMAKTEFIRYLSHETRNPLSVILNAAELALVDEMPHARVRELCQRIARQGRALARLLDDVLDLSKVEAQHMAFDLRPVRPASIVADVAASLQDEALSKKVTLSVGPFREMQGAIVDPQRLRQILMNVVGNAIKFGAGGEVRVRIPQSDDPSFGWIEIADDGVGLDATQAARLFTPFEQGGESVTRRFGGTGLGLVLSKRLANAMGGDLVLVDSAAGKGSVFRIVLRAAPLPESEKSRRALPVAMLDGMRILLVDDDAEVLGVTADLLASVGAVIVDVDDAERAIEVAADKSFDVILMDVNMPGVHGLEAARRLRAMGVHTPILALTAEALVIGEDEWRSAGCDGLVAKPIELERLAAVIDAVCVA